MNVSKINTLSEQHKALKGFHKVCTYNSVELRVKHDPYSEASLDSEATETILSKVRMALLERISDIEAKIKKEASNG